MGISINNLAVEMNVPAIRISQIVNERRGITADNCWPPQSGRDAQGRATHLYAVGRAGAGAKLAPHHAQ